MAGTGRGKIVTAGVAVVLTVCGAVASPAREVRASRPLQIYPTYPVYTYPTATPYVYPTRIVYPTAIVYPTRAFTATTVPSPTSSPTATSTSTATPTATSSPNSTPTPTSTPTSTSTATPQPSIVITGAAILHKVGRSWRRTTTIYLDEIARFKLSADTTNPGSSTAAARIDITKRGATVHRGSMAPGPSGQPQIFLAEYRFHGPSQRGKLSARLTLALGPVTDSRTIQFTVKARP